MHPLLVPGEWFVEGRYHPAGKATQRVTGVTTVHAAEEYPETLRVQGEIRSAEDPGARPVHSSFHLDVVSSQTVRFRMDSLPLATVLVGEGHFDEDTMVIRYASPDRRIVGVETFVGPTSDDMRHAGVILADGSPVTSWIARLERVRGKGSRRPNSIKS